MSLLLAADGTDDETLVRWSIEDLWTMKTEELIRRISTCDRFVEQNGGSAGMSIQEV